MTYRLDKISIKIEDNKKVLKRLMKSIMTYSKEKIPLIRNNKRKTDKDLIPIGQYENYRDDEYTLTIFADDYDTLLQIYKWINYGDIMEFRGSGSSIDQARKMLSINLLYIGVLKEHLPMILKLLFQI